MKRLLSVLAAACIALVGGASVAFANRSGGVTAPSIYINGVLYRTAEIDAGLADPGPGGATDRGVVKLFECPVIPAH